MPGRCIRYWVLCFTATVVQNKTFHKLRMIFEYKIQVSYYLKSTIKILILRAVSFSLRLGWVYDGLTGWLMGDQEKNACRVSKISPHHDKAFFT